MNRLAIRAVHDSALGKAKSLLIKAHSSRYVGDGEHSRYGAVLLLVEWINFLLSHSAPLLKTNILANTNVTWGAVNRGALGKQVFQWCGHPHLLTGPYWTVAPELAEPTAWYSTLPLWVA